METQEMYARIVVPLDGSPEAETILSHVEALAARLGSAVTLVRVQTERDTYLAQSAASDLTGMAVVDPTPIIAAEREEAARYLAQVAQRLREQGMTVGVEHPEGAAVDAILRVAEREHADLIAMVTHAQGGLGRFVLGSTAEAILHRAACPLLLVPHRAAGAE